VKGVFWGVKEGFMWRRYSEGERKGRIRGEGGGGRCCVGEEQDEALGIRGPVN